MSDLHDIANRKIAAECHKLVKALPQRIEAAKRRQAAHGMLRSGNTAALLRDICIEPLQAMGAQIIQEYKWAAATAIVLTQSFARSLADAADTQFAPLVADCRDQLSSPLEDLNMANLAEEVMLSLESKRKEVLIDVRIELDRAFAERRRGVIRNFAVGVGNVIGKLGGR